MLFDRRVPGSYTSRMAIQFNCPGCHQPIEVDDEWAGQHVACPFCQRVVTTPLESALRAMDVSVPPAARKMTIDDASAAEAGRGMVGPTSTRLARVGMVLSVGAVVLWIAGMIMVQPLMRDLGPNPTPQEMQKKMLDSYSNPESASKMLLGGGAMCMGFTCWVAGLVVSIIALSVADPSNRRPAVIGLACSGALPLLFCLSSTFSG